MKPSNYVLRILNIILGILSIAFLIINFVVLVILQPKMVGFLPLSGLEETLLTSLGVAQVMIFLYFLFSLLQAIRYAKFTEEVKPLWVLLIIGGVISLLFVFINISLVGDIYKQYQAKLSQPEWAFVYPAMVFQLLVAVIFFVQHVSKRMIPKHVEKISRDINIYLIVQYIGLISGLTGLVYTSLGFVYARGWTLLVHTVLGSLAIIFPYVLVILYWVMTKLREGGQPWWDEKQSVDRGKSALLTLAISTILMLVLFVANYQNLAGVVRYLWMPYYGFSVMTLFSGGNLYYSSRG